MSCLELGLTRRSQVHIRAINRIRRRLAHSLKLSLAQPLPLPCPDSPLPPAVFLVSIFWVTCCTLPELHTNPHLRVCFCTMFAPKGGSVGRGWALERALNSRVWRAWDVGISVTTYWFWNLLQVSSAFLASVCSSVKWEECDHLANCCEVGHIICMVPGPSWPFYKF